MKFIKQIAQRLNPDLHIPGTDNPPPAVLRKSKSSTTLLVTEKRKELSTPPSHASLRKKASSMFLGRGSNIQDFANWGDTPIQSSATLQAEAAELFDQHGPGEQETHGRGAFNPAYRGRGYAPFAPRGRGFGPYRGAYRGRAGGYAGRGVVNKKLDNRPRRLAVTQIQPDTPRDESLRQHLLVSRSYTWIHSSLLTIRTEYTRMHKYRASPRASRHPHPNLQRALPSRNFP